jgi:hypothetical protein
VRGREEEWSSVVGLVALVDCSHSLVWLWVLLGEVGMAGLACLCGQERMGTRRRRGSQRGLPPLLAAESVNSSAVCYTRVLPTDILVVGVG